MSEGLPFNKEVLSDENERKEGHEKLKNFTVIIIKPMGAEYSAQIMEKLLEHGEIKHFQAVVSTEEQVAEHYSNSQFDSDGQETQYFPGLVKYMSEKNMDVFILEGANDQNCFIENLRKNVIGPSNPEKTEEGQIRNLAKNLDYKKELTIKGEGVEKKSIIIDNLIHCSDSQESALKEIRIWFGDVIAEDYKKRLIKNEDE